jgi:hypothetical protein
MMFVNEDRVLDDLRTLAEFGRVGTPNPTSARAAIGLVS